MKIRIARQGNPLLFKVRQLWVLFGISLIALTCAAIFGTQPVRASSACTTQQCGVAQAYAQDFCSSLSPGWSLNLFACPLNPPENDDFYFDCKDQYGGQRGGWIEDCANLGNPS